MTTLPNAIRTGGEIDAFCTKCDLNLAHTIVAMVGPKVIKVQCNTCQSLHQYKGTQPLVKAQSFAAPKKSSASRSVAPRAPVVTWDEQLRNKDLSRAKKYSTKETFAVDDVVDHPTFGLGLVTAVRVDKIDVAFKAFDKTLMHAKPGAPAAAPAPVAAPSSAS